MTDGAAVVSMARTAIGDPYLWGGVGPNAFDCSGLIYWAYGRCGVSIPRTSQAQASGGTPVGYSSLLPGDVVTFYPGATHAALYSGDGNIIQASQPGVPVEEVPLAQGGPFNDARRYLEATDTVTLYYPDVSNNNWSSDQELTNFLSQLHGQGFAGVVHKVSEGNYYQDPYWQPCRTWCENNNLSWLGYHYVTTNDPASQVRTWLGNDGGPNVMFDFEANSGDINNFWALVSAFNSAGVNVSLAYIPNWYWGKIGYPDLSGLTANQISLISSSYPDGSGYASDVYENSGGNSGPGWAPYGGASPTAWQFTDSAIVAGIRVDCNAYNGPGTNLDALFTGNVF